MFQKIELDPDGGGNIGAYWLNSPVRRLPDVASDWREQVSNWAHVVDLTPDLGHDIGSATWWRGLATCLSLCGGALMLSPGIKPVPGAAPSQLSHAHFDQFRAQMIDARAFGADTGAHMGPTDAVVPLAHRPERPHIDLDATLGTGDSFAHALERSGVSDADATAALRLIGQAVDPDSITAGTRLKMVLGARPNRSVPRPLDRLDVRARLDLALEVNRADGKLHLKRIPIAVDATPLRITGTVGDSLYRAARAAGADPTTIQAYLKVLATRIDVGSDLRAGDRFDIVVAHRRAATGESETGDLLFAGLERAHGKAIALASWTLDGRTQWFSPAGVGGQSGTMERPVNGGWISSPYGMRYHPILHITRMHAGVDIAVPYGTPIHAATDGRVIYAGWHGGHGRYVRIKYNGTYGTGYAHMSRIAATVGERVHEGEVIGYVGSSGLSTGPHLHYELYKNGHTINPMSMKFMQVARLSGKALSAFHARLAQYKQLPSGIDVKTAQALGATPGDHRPPERIAMDASSPTS